MRLGYASHHRQDRSLAIERLDLALLIDAQHESSVEKSRLELRGLRGLGHFRQRGQDLPFRVVDILQRVVEQVGELFVFFSPGGLR